MKLFYKAGVCSLAVHIVLEESGLPYSTEAVDLTTKKLASGADFLAINPKGYVPALLLDSGELLTEGPAITQYLADQVPERLLAPANGTLERTRLQSWLTFIGTELHKAFGPLFRNAPAEWKQVVLATLHQRLAYTDQQLAGKRFLTGDTFTIADAYLFTVLGWSRLVGLDLTPYANLTTFQSAVAARPAVQRVLKDEGLA